MVSYEDVPGKDKKFILDILNLAFSEDVKFKITDFNKPYAHDAKGGIGWTIDLKNDKKLFFRFSPMNNGLYSFESFGINKEFDKKHVQIHNGNDKAVVASNLFNWLVGIEREFELDFEFDNFFKKQEVNFDFDIEDANKIWDTNLSDVQIEATYHLLDRLKLIERGNKELQIKMDEFQSELKRSGSYKNFKNIRNFFLVYITENVLDEVLKNKYICNLDNALYFIVNLHLNLKNLYEHIPLFELQIIGS